MKIAILGAGSFGTALAHVFAGNVDRISLWSRSLRQSPRFENLKMAANIEETVDLRGALSQARFVIVALPMTAVRVVLEQCRGQLEADAIVVSTTKGVDPESLEFPSQIIMHALHNFDPNRLAVMSGPNFASEIAQDLPWASVVACASSTCARTVQSVLIAKNLKMYHSSDVLGVELGGAIKNVYAIAAGAVDGLNLGCNARATMMTRALAEMTRFALALGAKEETVYGLSGLGDLLLSCTSEKSRNWRLGNGLARGHTLKKIQNDLGEVIEGVGTTKAAMKLAHLHKIDAPICQGVYSALFENVSIQGIMDAGMAKVGVENSA